MDRGLQIALVIVGVLILLGASFYGGTLFGKQQAQAALPQRVLGFQQMLQQGDVPGAEAPQALGRRFGGQAGGQAGRVSGPIESIEGDVMVIDDFSGAQKRVQVTETTLIEKYASVTAADLEVGEQVMVSGSENEDGSVTARSIQVAPAGRFAPGGWDQESSQ